MTIDKNTLNLMNKTLRGLLAGVHSYDQVLEALQGDSKYKPVAVMRDDHMNTVKELRTRIQANGSEPDKDAGAWGTFAETVTGTAKVLGDKASFKALKEGEEHGIKLFEELRDQSENLDIKTFADKKCLPQQKEHIQQLDSLMQNM